MKARLVKVLLIGLLFVLLLGCTGLFQKPASVYLINEDFESYEVGTEPNVPWGYFLSAEGSSGYISDRGRNSGNALTFEDPTIEGFVNLGGHADWKPFKSCTVEYDFRVAQDGIFGVRLFADDETKSFIEPYIIVNHGMEGWGLYAVSSIFQESWQESWNAKFLAYIEADRWYRVRVDFCYVENRYDVYLDGDFVGNREISGTIDNSLNWFQIATFPSSTCNWVDIDNVILKVHDEGYEVDTETSSSEK